MGARRNREGPLITAQIVQIGTTDGVIFWDRTNPPKILPLTTDVPYVVKFADRHDALARAKLGSSQLGWAIMERNNDIESEEVDMRLWPNDFVPGQLIKIPTRRSLSDRGIV